MDPVHTTAKTVSHYRYTALALALTVALTALAGCYTGTARNPETGKKMTAVALEAEARVRLSDIQGQMAALQAEAEGVAESYQIAIDSANEKTERVNALISGLATTVLDSPLLATLGLGTWAGSIGTAVGLAADSRRKDRVLKKKKAGGDTA